MLTLAEAPPTPAMPDADAPHAVVIGSGFGGLAAAVRLGARGWRVTVVERLDQPGGRAAVFRQDGYTFDAGPTIVTAPFLFEELWALCGRRMADERDSRSDDAVLPDPVRTTGDHLDYSARCRRHARPDRADLAGRRGGLAGLHAGRARRSTASAFEELGDVPFGRFGDMLKIAPDLIRLRGHLSVHALVSRFNEAPEAARRLQLPPAPDRRQSIRGQRGSMPLINHLEQRWGVHFRAGRPPARWCAAWSG